MRTFTVKELVVFLFKRLCDIGYRNEIKVLSQSEYDSMIETWTQILSEHKITTPQQFQRAFKRIEKEAPDFMPKIGKFIEWTKPTLAELGIPSVDDAFQEACEKSSVYYHKEHGTDKPVQWSHPVVTYARNKTGAFALSNEPASKIKPRFESAYKEGIELFMEGNNLNMIESANRYTATHSAVTESQKDEEIKKGFEKYNTRDKAMAKIEEIINQPNLQKNHILKSLLS